MRLSPRTSFLAWYTYVYGLFKYTGVYEGILTASNLLLYVGILNLDMKFVGKVSKMGDKLIVVIPKEHHKDAEKLREKPVKVSLDEVVL